VAIPFAILVLFLVRRLGPNPRWAALTAAIVTLIAFVCAVNVGDLGRRTSGRRRQGCQKYPGWTGRAVSPGATIMALGICLLPAAPRDAVAWLPMLATGTIAGALLALDNALDLDLTSFLYPVWQATVAVGSRWRSGGPSSPDTASAYPPCIQTGIDLRGLRSIIAPRSP